MPERIIRDATHSDAFAIQQIYAPYVIETPISFEIEPPDEAEMLRRMNRVTERFPWLVLEHGLRDPWLRLRYPVSSAGGISELG